MRQFEFHMMEGSGYGTHTTYMKLLLLDVAGEHGTVFVPSLSISVTFQWCGCISWRSGKSSAKWYHRANHPYQSTTKNMATPQRGCSWEYLCLNSSTQRCSWTGETGVLGLQLSRQRLRTLSLSAKFTQCTRRNAASFWCSISLLTRGWSPTQIHIHYVHPEMLEPHLQKTGEN